MIFEKIRLSTLRMPNYIRHSSKRYSNLYCSNRTTGMVPALHETDLGSISSTMSGLLSGVIPKLTVRNNPKSLEKDTVLAHNIFKC